MIRKVLLAAVLIGATAAAGAATPSSGPTLSLGKGTVMINNGTQFVTAKPGQTLKAGDHGVPGGENTLVDDAGAIRYFTVREAARIQTFPDEYRFAGAWTEGFRQLGNAVPVKLAEAVAASVAKRLK